MTKKAGHWFSLDNFITVCEKKLWRAKRHIKELWNVIIRKYWMLQLSRINYSAFNNWSVKLAKVKVDKIANVFKYKFLIYTDSMSNWVRIYEGVAVRGVALPVSQFRYLRGAESAHCQPPLRSKSLRPIHRAALYPVSKPIVHTHFINTFHWVLNKNESSYFCHVCSAF